MPDGHGRIAGSLVVLAAAACFGTLGPVSRLAYEEGVAPLAFTAWRSTVGAAVLLAVILIRGAGPRMARTLVGLDRAARRSLATATLAGLLLNLAIFTAFGRVTVALALLIFYTYPAMLALAAAARGTEPIGRRQAVALGLALAGMTLVVASQLEPAVAATVDPIGVLLALAAGACQAVYVSVSRTGYPTVPSDQATTVILGGGALAALALTSATLGPPALGAPFADASAGALTLVAGLLGAGLPSFLFLVGVRLIGPLRTGTLALLEPVVGVVLAAVVLAEAIQPVQLVGGALVLVAAVCLQDGTDGRPCRTGATRRRRSRSTTSPGSPPPDAAAH